jgi:hypothetical protein
LGHRDRLKGVKVTPKKEQAQAGLKLKESGRTFIIRPERERSNAERGEPATGREVAAVSANIARQRQLLDLNDRHCRA